MCLGSASAVLSAAAAPAAAVAPATATDLACGDPGRPSGPARDPLCDRDRAELLGAGKVRASRAKIAPTSTTAAEPACDDPDDAALYDARPTTATRACTHSDPAKAHEDTRDTSEQLVLRADGRAAAGWADAGRLERPLTALWRPAPQARHATCDQCGGGAKPGSGGGQRGRGTRG